jgi:hypothetical protein
VKDDIIKQKVKEAYGKIALVGTSSEGCCAPGECCSGSSSGSSNGSQTMMSPSQIAESIGYNANDLKSIPESSILGVGCGAPVNFAISRKEKLSSILVLAEELMYFCQQIKSNSLEK